MDHFRSDNTQGYGPAALGRNDYLERKRVQNSNFDPSDLARKFVPYFESGQRIKVRMRRGEIFTGTVGVTTGWKPVFLLMRRRDSTGSWITLSGEDEILGYRVGKRYQTTFPPASEPA